MNKFGLIGLLLASTLSVPAIAGGINGDAVIGGALGGAAGAAIGSAVGGRNGAIIGGGLGGATGAAVATSGQRDERTRREVVYVDDDHHDNGRHRGHYKRHHGHDHDD